MKIFTFTNVLMFLFVAYISHSIYSLYHVFHPKHCQPDRQCLHSYLRQNPKLEIKVYTSQHEKVRSESDLNLIWKNASIDVNDVFEVSLNVTLPRKTRNNGTLYAHVFISPHGESSLSGRRSSYAISQLTTYMIRKADTFNLIGDKSSQKRPQETGDKTKARPVTHWRSKLLISVMTDNIPIERYGIPGPIYKFLKLSPDGDYLPMLYIDDLSLRIKDLVEVKKTEPEVPLQIRYAPISLGRLQLWVQISESFSLLKKLGFSDKDTDEVKGIFTDTNFLLLMLTFTIAAFHLLFDFLAFKNDIQFWKERETMVGLSSRMVVWRCVSTIVIFFYLMDEDTSLLVLIPAGIGTLIEVWKVKKAFKLKILWSGLKPSFEFGLTSDKEKETEAFDSQAMKYLSYVLFPLCIGGAIYSMMYTPFKSWYSWCIHSLVNGVYAFGFLFMLPQLFLNYKLKSVAHLPWRAFMYKAFNTFIDDVFAFIITMPTAHRVACFRDDLVFVIYLYQRWLYPVDKTRVNEYGQTFVKDDSKEINNGGQFDGKKKTE
ncbi:lipid scramblase CLPTM1L-like [Lineus longissimus]|uniref:lipid scramblase CLPTM1L-like n=1 Tax=Lineus longissimus TaxID=88925 RepID=UPI002B4D5A0C